MKTEAKMIIAGTVFILLFGAISNSLINGGQAATTDEINNSPLGSYACTTDAKICPDGSYVGRVAPYCQFAACPGE